MKKSFILILGIILLLFPSNAYCSQEENNKGIMNYVFKYFYLSFPKEYLLKNVVPEEKGIKTENAVKQAEDITKDYSHALELLGYNKKESADKNLNLRNSILRFQSDHNLKVNGVWDKNSQANLQKRVETGKLKYKDIIKSPPTKDNWIVINKTKRILTLYQGSNVLRKFPIAVGNPSPLTPTGKFYIANKLVNPTWLGGGYAKPIMGGDPSNPLGERWMGLSYKGGGQFGIHGNASPYSIGLDVSHGCVRMINSDVKELFDMVTVNIAVWIGTEDILGNWGIIQEEYYKGQ